MYRSSSAEGAASKLPWPPPHAQKRPHATPTCGYLRRERGKGLEVTEKRGGEGGGHLFK